LFAKKRGILLDSNIARLKQDTQDKYILLIKFVFDECEHDFNSRKPSFKAFNILILFYQVIDEITFQNKFIDLIIDKSELIIANIDKVSNQEIIQNIVVRTNSLEKVIATYEQASYKEMLNIYKIINIDKFRFILENEKEQYEPALTKRDNVLERFLLMSGSLHFYTITLLSQNNFITILKNMINKKLGIRPKVKSKIKELVKYYDSLDDEKKKTLESILKDFL
jgi:hypothetical protein